MKRPSLRAVRSSARRPVVRAVVAVVWSRALRDLWAVRVFAPAPIPVPAD